MLFASIACLAAAYHTTGKPEIKNAAGSGAENI